MINEVFTNDISIDVLCNTGIVDDLCKASLIGSILI